MSARRASVAGGKIAKEGLPIRAMLMAERSNLQRLHPTGEGRLCDGKAVEWQRLIFGNDYLGTTTETI